MKNHLDWIKIKKNLPLLIKSSWKKGKRNIKMKWISKEKKTSKILFFSWLITSAKIKIKDFTFKFYATKNQIMPEVRLL